MDLGVFTEYRVAIILPLISTVEFFRGPWNRMHVPKRI